MHKNFHRSYGQGNWGVTVGSRVNLVRAQRTLARLEAQKLFRPNIPEVEGLRTRIRGLRDLRVLGSRIQGSLFETFSDDKGLEFEAPCSRPSPTTKGSNSKPPRPKSPRPSNSRPMLGAESSGIRYSLNRNSKFECQQPNPILILEDQGNDTYSNPSITNCHAAN
jgi:hypothetical protein